MAAQKRPLPPPASDDSDGHVAACHAAASRGEGGASHRSDGEATARQARAPPREPRDGGFADPDEKDRGGGGDVSDSDSESSPSAGDKDDRTRYGS